MLARFNSHASKELKTVGPSLKELKAGSDEVAMNCQGIPIREDSSQESREAGSARMRSSKDALGQSRRLLPCVTVPETGKRG